MFSIMGIDRNFRESFRNFLGQKADASNAKMRPCFPSYQK